MEISNTYFKMKKATGKYNKSWNSKLKDCSIESLNFECDVSPLRIKLESHTNFQHNKEEIQFFKVYLTELVKQATIAKMTELESWEEQEVYCEVEDSIQSCISVLKWF